MFKNQKLHVMILTAIHGTLPLRGQVLEGIVVSNKAERTISVERSYYKFIKKI